MWPQLGTEGLHTFHKVTRNMLVAVNQLLRLEPFNHIDYRRYHLNDHIAIVTEPTRTVVIGYTGERWKKFLMKPKNRTITSKTSRWSNSYTLNNWQGYQKARFWNIGESIPVQCRETQFSFNQYYLVVTAVTVCINSPIMTTSSSVTLMLS